MIPNATDRLRILKNLEFSKETLSCADKIVNNYINLEKGEYKLLHVEQDDLNELAGYIFLDEPELLREALSPDNPHFKKITSYIIDSLIRFKTLSGVQDEAYDYIAHVVEDLLDERLSFAIDMMDGVNNEND